MLQKVHQASGPSSKSLGIQLSFKTLEESVEKSHGNNTDSISSGSSDVALAGPQAVIGYSVKQKSDGYTVSHEDADPNLESSKDISAKVFSTANRGEVSSSVVLSHLLQQQSLAHTCGIDDSCAQIGTGCDSEHFPAVKLYSVEHRPVGVAEAATAHTSSSAVEANSSNVAATKAALTKSMISNALFNPKARTKLFSTIKKNIQYYTNTGNADHEMDIARSKRNRCTLAELRSNDTQHERYQCGEGISISGSLEVEDAQKMNMIHTSDSGGKWKYPSASGESDLKPPPRPSKLPSSTISFSSLLTEREQSKKENTTLNHANAPTESIETPPPSPTELKGKREVEVSKPALQHSSSVSNVYTSFIIVYVYLILPVPSSVHIALCFFLLGVISSVFAMCMLTSTKTHKIRIHPPYINRCVPAHIPTSVYDPGQSLKGWMNEIECYDVDTYHVRATKSVFITLEATTLRLQTPSRNIPRRATFGEGSIILSNVVHQRLYDISSAKLYLLPHDLVKKRVWSKKYPICIEISAAVVRGISRKNEATKLYLFGRTQRQKEEWFYRLQSVIARTQMKQNERETYINGVACGEVSWKHVDDGDDSELLLNTNIVSTVIDPDTTFNDYFLYMSRLLPDPKVYSEVTSGLLKSELSGVAESSFHAIRFSSSGRSSATPEVVVSQPGPLSQHSSSGDPGLDIAWLNVFLGRVMFDFFRFPHWADWISKKIQRKLEKIRLPYFIEGLRLTDIDLGDSIPLVHKVSLPRLDSQGIWFDVEVAYNGVIQLTLETKMILTKLGKQSCTTEKKKLAGSSAVTNSDEEDSAESSEDEESTMSRLVTQMQSAAAIIGPPDSTLNTSLHHLSSNNNMPQSKAKVPLYASDDVHTQHGSGTPTQEKKWVKIVDSIATSKYFQRAVENSYIRKKLETVSNTPLILTAELHQFQGVMCINIPPPPSDRIWYGFKDHPYVVLRAHPKFGERVVTVARVTDWIEKKLLQEIHKLLLMPNMEDIQVPMMFSNLTTAQQ